MSFKIAEAFVEVVVDGKTAIAKFNQDFEKSTNSNNPGEKIGGAVLSGLGGVIGGGIAAVGAIAATGFGVAMSKGLDRLVAIDNAKAKLDGLGHSAETVELIMGNALNSVRGTAFGLGDAAGVAASAVAAGIAPGEALERTLKLVADASTIAGTDMGSMGAIFNKVAASNKVQMDTINQLHDAGVPALALLAKQMGVTAEEAAKMASAGEIDFATFQAAMESGMGGAALKSGATFEGAMANAQAALGRIGANFLGGVFPQLTGAFSKLQEGLGPVEEKAAALGDKFGDMAGDVVPILVDGLLGIANAMIDMGTWISENTKLITDLGTAIGIGAGALIIMNGAVAAYNAIMGVFKAVQAAGTVAQWAFNLAAAANPVGLVVLAIAALIAIIVLLVLNWDAVVAWLTEVWNGFISWFTGVMDGFFGWWNGVWAGFASWVVEVWNGFISWIVEVWSGFVAWLVGIGDGIAAWWNALWAGIALWVITTWNNFIAFVTAVFTAYVATLFAIGASIGSWWNSLWAGVGSFFSGIWNGIVSFGQTAINNLVNFFTGLPGRIMGVLAGAGTWLVGVGRDIINGLTEGIRGAVEGVLSFITDVGNNIMDAAKNVLGIHSPSRRMRDEVGRPIVQGIAGGVEDEEDELNRTIQSMVKIPKVDTAFDSIGSAYARNGARVAQTGDTYEIRIGSITIDAKSIAEFVDIIEMIKKLPQVARAGRGVTVGG